MADQLLFTNPLQPGLTTFYAVLEKGASAVKVADGSLIVRSPSNRPAVAIALSDSVTPGFYIGSVPAGTPANRYDLNIYQRSGRAGTELDSDPLVGNQAGGYYWTGSVEANLAISEGSGPVEIQIEQVTVNT